MATIVRQHQIPIAKERHDKKFADERTYSLCVRNVCVSLCVSLIQDNVSSGLKLFVDYIMKNSRHENTLGLISDIRFSVGNAS